MPLIYITGPTGAGKTTVRNELRKRGYDAYDTDEGINGHVNTETGQATDYPGNEVTAEWLAQHTYNMSPEEIERLSQLARHKLVFVCGAAYNDLEMAHHFSKVICLTVDKPTAKERIETRTTNNFGRLPSEMASIMERHHDVIAKYRDAGAHIIDTTYLSLQETTDAVLKIADEAYDAE